MPAVRMIRVCPMAMTPTTITCCRMSEKFWPVRKRSVCDAKNAHAASSARQWAERRNRRHALEQVARGYFAPQHASMPNLVSLLSTPDMGWSVMSVTPVSV